MKKNLFFLSFLLIGLTGLRAQCTIAPTCSITNGYCSTPATGTALPNATELTAYSTVIQVSIATTYSIATIIDATVTSVSGMPTGLSYSTNPTNGVIIGGASGCILIAGTPAASTAGNYTVTANVSVNTNFGVVPGSFAWTLTVDPFVGIATHQAPAASLFLSPNPATSELNLIADFNFKNVQVYDALGNIVLSHDANNSYKAVINLQPLNPGLYFLQIIDGNRIITRKFFKE